MKPFVRYTLFGLLWVAVAAYVIYAAVTVRTQRDGKRVSRTEIIVADSSSMGHLVSAEVVRGWIAKSGIATSGAPVARVQLDALEQMIARNGFVKEVNAYVTYAGVLRITISQRLPSLRLLIDGFDAYVTDAGFVFAAPQASSLYVPVVTGSYVPPFTASYTGSVRTCIDAEHAKIDKQIAALEREKYPFYARELQNDRNTSALRRMRIKKHWWRMESSREFERRTADLQQYKIEMLKQYRYNAILIQQGIDSLSARQEAARRQQKKSEQNFEDFTKLLNFVKFVENDDFWRAEIVQIVARTAPSGALEAELIPRSGRYIIVFGRLEEIAGKFDKLLRFYRGGLTRIGWDTYRIIDIRYKDQVVCLK